MLIKPQLTVQSFGVLTCTTKGLLTCFQVKFTQSSWHDKLTKILEDFPKVDDMHPFFGDLLNVLYDRDHYKLALGQLHTARNLIDKVSQGMLTLSCLDVFSILLVPNACLQGHQERETTKVPTVRGARSKCNAWTRETVLRADYVRLMKYGDSLYRCKELKRAALVRPCRSNTRL